MDMCVDSNLIQDWENLGSGYEGHHTKKVTNGETKYEIAIKISNINVFQGILSFTLDKDLRSTDKATGHDEIVSLER